MMKRILFMLQLIPLASIWGADLYQGRLENILIPPGGVVPFSVTIVHKKTASLVSLRTNSFHQDIEFGMDTPRVVETADGRNRTVITGSLQVFAITNIVFDGFRVTMRQGGHTNFRVLARSQITVARPPVNTKKKPLILPAKGPLPYPGSHTLLLVTLSVLLLAGGGFFWWYKKKRSAEATSIPRMATDVDPWVLAVQRLDYLRERTPDTEQDIKDYYFELTETARIYLTGRTGLHFEESTTSELKKLLSDVTWINEAEGEALVILFQDADLVKFAKFRPEEDSVRAFFAEIESWLKVIDGEYTRHTLILRNGGQSDGI